MTHTTTDGPFDRTAIELMALQATYDLRAWFLAERLDLWESMFGWKRILHRSYHRTVRRWAWNSFLAGFYEGLLGSYTRRKLKRWRTGR